MLEGQSLGPRGSHDALVAPGPVKLTPSISPSNSPRAIARLMVILGIIGTLAEFTGHPDPVHPDWPLLSSAFWATVASRMSRGGGPQFTSGITSAARATRTGADGVATQAGTAMAQLATHAGTWLEDDAAAAHAGLTRDADAASAALHAGFSERCGVPWNAVGLTR